MQVQNVVPDRLIFQVPCPCILMLACPLQNNTLSLEKAGDFGRFIRWDSRKDFVCCFHISTKNEGLVFNNGETEPIRYNIDILVCEIDSTVSGDVSQKIKIGVNMSNSVCLFTNQILQSVRGGVNQNITYPFCSAYTEISSKLGRTYFSLRSAITSKASSTPSF